MAGFGVDWPAKREWFDVDPARQERHPAALAELDRAEAERAELAALESDLTAQGAWFNADPERRQRHPDDHRALLDAIEAEQLRVLIAGERRELESLGHDWDKVRPWFAAAAGRPERHREKHSELQAWIRRLEREQKALAELGNNWAEMRKWFNRVPGRRQRHPAALEELELARQESAELRRLGGDLSAQRAWFDQDPERRQRHPDDHRALLDAIEAEQLRVLIASERLELESLGDDWTEVGRWFAAAAGRPERHPQKYADLEAAEEAERALEQERLEVAGFGVDWPAKREWFDVDPARQERHPAALAELDRAEAERAELDKLSRKGDLTALRDWFNTAPVRRERHPDSYESLLEAEEAERVRALTAGEKHGRAAISNRLANLLRRLNAMFG